MWNTDKIIRKGDYNYLYVPEHPRATRDGYVLEHRIVVENHLNRLLRQDEVVHHVDGNGKNNRIDNLLVMTQPEHASMHRKDHGRKFVQLKCPECSTIFTRPHSKTHLAKGGSATFCSRKCSGLFTRKKQLHGVTARMNDAISENIVLEYTKYPSDNTEETG